MIFLMLLLALMLKKSNLFKVPIMIRLFWSIFSLSLSKSKVIASLRKFRKKRKKLNQLLKYSLPRDSPKYHQGPIPESSKNRDFLVPLWKNFKARRKNLPRSFYLNKNLTVSGILSEEFIFLKGKSLKLQNRSQNRLPKVQISQQLNRKNLQLRFLR